jgi:hypothetical protein
VQPLLLQHDLGVAAQVGEVRAGVHRRHRHPQVEVVREGAHHRRHAFHGVADPRAVVGVHLLRRQPAAEVRLEEGGKRVDLEVGDDHLVVRVGQQVVGTRRTLQARAEHEHPHTVDSCRKGGLLIDIEARACRFRARGAAR